MHLDSGVASREGQDHDDGTSASSSWSPSQHPQSFDVRKRMCLAELQSSLPDKSPKGGLDSRIEGLVAAVNAHWEFYTTSSCSGRISVFASSASAAHPSKQPSAADGCDAWSFRPSISEEEETWKRKTKGKTKKKGGGDWVFVSHDTVDVDRLIAAVRHAAAASPSSCLSPSLRAVASSSPPPSQPAVEEQTKTQQQQQQQRQQRHQHHLLQQHEHEVVQQLVLRYEPFILALECRTADAANRLVACAIRAGFRESGITSIGPRRVIAAVRSSLRMEVPLTDSCGQLMVGDSYVRRLCELANEKMQANWERTDRFLAAFVAESQQWPLCDSGAVSPRMLDPPAFADTSAFATRSGRQQQQQRRKQKQQQEKQKEQQWPLRHAPTSLHQHLLGDPRACTVDAALGTTMQQGAASDSPCSSTTSGTSRGSSSNSCASGDRAHALLQRQVHLLRRIGALEGQHLGKCGPHRGSRSCDGSGGRCGADGSSKETMSSSSSSGITSRSGSSSSTSTAAGAVGPAVTGPAVAAAARVAAEAKGVETASTASTGARSFSSPLAARTLNFTGVPTTALLRWHHTAVLAYLPWPHPLPAKQSTASNPGPAPAVTAVANATAAASLPLLPPLAPPPPQAAMAPAAPASGNNRGPASGDDRGRAEDQSSTPVHTQDGTGQFPVAVVFGGYGSGCSGAARRLNDTIALDVRRCRASLLHTAGALPPPRMAHSACVWLGDFSPLSHSTNVDQRGQPSLLHQQQQQEQQQQQQLMVVFGGRAHPGDSMNDVHVLDLSSLRWHSPASAAATNAHVKPRFRHAAAIAGSRMFVFGGLPGADIHAPLADLQVLCLKTWTWHDEPRATGRSPFPRHSHAMATLGDSVYLFGGRDSKTVFSDLYQLDVTSWPMRWSLLARLTPDVLPGRFSCSLLPVGQSLVIFGGCPHAKQAAWTMPVINPMSQTVQRCEICLPTGVLPARHAAVAVTDKDGGPSLFVCGGGAFCFAFGSVFSPPFRLRLPMPLLGRGPTDKLGGTDVPGFPAGPHTSQQQSAEDGSHSSGSTVTSSQGNSPLPSNGEGKGKWALVVPRREGKAWKDLLKGTGWLDSSVAPMTMPLPADACDALRAAVIASAAVCGDSRVADKRDTPAGWISVPAGYRAAAEDKSGGATMGAGPAEGQERERTVKGIPEAVSESRAPAEGLSEGSATQAAAEAASTLNLDNAVRVMNAETAATVCIAFPLHPSCVSDARAALAALPKREATAAFPKREATAALLGCSDSQSGLTAQEGCWGGSIVGSGGSDAGRRNAAGSGSCNCGEGWSAPGKSSRRAHIRHRCSCREARSGWLSGAAELRQLPFDSASGSASHDRFKCALAASASPHQRMRAAVELMLSQCDSLLACSSGSPAQSPAACQQGNGDDGRGERGTTHSSSSSSSRNSSSDGGSGSGSGSSSGSSGGDFGCGRGGGDSVSRGCTADGNAVLGQETRRALLSSLPKKWERLGDMAILPHTSFRDADWALFVPQLWHVVATSLGAKRLARQAPIAATGTRDSQLELLLGDSAVVQHRENGITYCLDAARCMFSSGNGSEKQRMARLNCAGEVVVDLFAGVGYFTLPLLVHSKASHVYACEWNPVAATWLREGLRENGVASRCTVLEGDNRGVAPKGVADRVLLGLIPSSEGSWTAAVLALKAKGGVLHVHGNANGDEESKWVENVRSSVEERARCERRVAWRVRVACVTRVKWYAPHIRHLVVDLVCDIMERNELGS